MSFSKFLQETKVIELEGETFTIKKFPYSFQQYLTIKSLENKKLNFDEKGKLESVKNLGDFQDFTKLYPETLLNGIALWSLDIPLSLENCNRIINEAPKLADFLIKNITEFNTVEEDTKKKLNSTLKK